MMVRLATLWAALLLALPLIAQQENNAVDNTTRETMEWANLWWEHAPDTKLPRALLIGDSITNGYHRGVANLLKGRVNVDMLATSANILDPAFMAQLKVAVGDYKHAVIHFNNGLHGFHLTDAQYEAGLRRLVEALKELAPQAKLIWAHSTPIADANEVANPASNNPVVIGRNAIAARVMAEYGIPVDDLYTLMLGHPEWRNKGDGYHYNQAGKTPQSEQVAKLVAEALGL
jgi:lysophospholipase L1-like esterase